LVKSERWEAYPEQALGRVEWVIGDNFLRAAKRVVISAFDVSAFTDCHNGRRGRPSDWTTADKPFGWWSAPFTVHLCLGLAGSVPRPRD
jgi:hypothetical protein